MGNPENINQSANHPDEPTSPARSPRFPRLLKIIGLVVVVVIFVVFGVVFIYFVTSHSAESPASTKTDDVVSDSFGNICGVDNQPVSGLPLSGMNMTGRPYKYTFGYNGVSICVPECPQRDIPNEAELYRYYQERQVMYCQYDFNMSRMLHAPEGSLQQYYDQIGPCTTLPVFRSIPERNRCVPIGKKATVSARPSGNPAM